jgi:hypothetical protein
MCIAFLLDRGVNRILRSRRAGNIVYYLASGLFGLAVEWLVVGNSPWANPSAIQITMFLYWSGMFMLPRIFTDPDPLSKAVKMKLIRAYVIYSLIHLIFSVSVSLEINAVFVPILWTAAYLYLTVVYILPYIFKKNQRPAFEGH